MAREEIRQPAELNEEALDDANGGIIAILPEQKGRRASAYPGGVTVALADGSVRFLKPSI